MHRMRDDPYPDELDQQFCDECGTLCIPPDEDGYDWRPCECCYVAFLEDSQLLRLGHQLVYQPVSRVFCICLGP